MGKKQMVPKDSGLPLLRSLNIRPSSVLLYIPPTATYLSILSREVHQGRPLVTAILISALDYTLALCFHWKIEEDSFFKLSG